MVKRHSITGIAACLAAVAFIASCGNDPKPVAPAGEPAAKIAHPGHDAQSAVVADLSDDREVMAAVHWGHSNDGLAREHWGYIDKQGRWVIRPQVDSVGTWQRNEQGRWVFVRRPAAFTGAVFTEAAAFSDGLAAVEDQETGEIGFIDNRGEWVIEPQFLSFDSRPLWVGGWSGGVWHGAWYVFSMGLAPVFDDKTGKYGFIDKSGAWAIDPQFTRTQGPFFAEGVAPVGGENADGDPACGYVNQSGDWFIAPQYQSCYAFYNGRRCAI